MITQLFWPREMRELASKYRTEGTLNEGNLSYINRRIVKVTLLAFIISAAMSATLYYAFPNVKELYFIVGALGISLLMIGCEVRKILYRYVLPINLGKDVEGKLLRCEKHVTQYGYHNGWLIEYSFISNGREFSKKFILDNVYWDSSLNKNKRISVLCTKDFSIPALSSLLEHFSLKTEIKL